MRIDLEVLISFDLIISTSMMQSVDESVSVSSIETDSAAANCMKVVAAA